MGVRFDFMLLFLLLPLKTNKLPTLLIIYLVFYSQLGCVSFPSSCGKSLLSLYGFPLPDAVIDPLTNFLLIAVLTTAWRALRSSYGNILLYIRILIISTLDKHFFRRAYTFQLMNDRSMKPFPS